MRTLADLSLNTLTVQPTDDAATALLAMQRHGVGAAAVMEGDALRGLVTIEAVILSEPQVLVAELMRGGGMRLQADEPVRQAAKVFVQQQADFLVVVDGDRFVGLVSALLFITELGRSFDAHTGLSWSDRLRDWGVEQLEAGREISVAFFDLNDFGQYNKLYGHTVGDAVLRAFAELLGRLVDTRKDVLVRYGGDEFAIGSTRSQAELLGLLSELRELSFEVDGVPAPVGFSYGVSGGKRTQEPSRTHVAATLDNLIGLASKACLANKPGALKGAVEVAPAVQGRLSVVSSAEEVEVHLQRGGEEIVGSASPNGSVWKAVAQAAADAVNQMEPNRELEIREMLFVGGADGKRVIVLGTESSSGEPRDFEAAGALEGSTDVAIARTVLNYAGLA
ncbi:MAG: diguanylate cyclase [Armatimonadetes bacterium]|nr:diguanylate cyclase [Armatimonadota bacterium]